MQSVIYGIVTNFERWDFIRMTREDVCMSTQYAGVQVIDNVQYPGAGLRTICKIVCGVLQEMVKEADRAGSVVCV